MVDSKQQGRNRKLQQEKGDCVEKFLFISHSLQFYLSSVALIPIRDNSLV